MAKQILWLSRHRPLPVQVRELHRIFGHDMQVRQDIDSFENADEIVRRFKQGGYEDLVVVAPESVLRRLVELGLKPIVADMVEVKTPGQQIDLTFSGRAYHFNGFDRIEEYVIRKTRL